MTFLTEQVEVNLDGPVRDASMPALLIALVPFASVALANLAAIAPARRTAHARAIQLLSDSTR